MHHPSYQLPRVLAWSLAGGFDIWDFVPQPSRRWVVAWWYVLVKMHCFLFILHKNLVPGGQPISVMFESTMGSNAGGVGMVSTSIFIVGFRARPHTHALQWFIGASRAVCGRFLVLTSSSPWHRDALWTSCTTWIFARDKAITFREVFARVNYNFNDAPVNTPSRHCYSTPWPYLPWVQRCF